MRVATQNRCRNRGNPNFGRPYIDTPNQPTHFELLTKRLNLTPMDWPGSKPLKAWCNKNKRIYYIPEALLEVWGWGESDVD